MSWCLSLTLNWFYPSLWQGEGHTPKQIPHLLKACRHTFQHCVSPRNPHEKLMIKLDWCSSGTLRLLVRTGAVRAVSVTGISAFGEPWLSNATSLHSTLLPLTVSVVFQQTFNGLPSATLGRLWRKCYEGKQLLRMIRGDMPSFPPQEANADSCLRSIAIIFRGGGLIIVLWFFFSLLWLFSSNFWSHTCPATMKPSLSLSLILVCAASLVYGHLVINQDACGSAC